ncbi:2Fe-2S iron-sulfur cluster-binding protein [Streptomyces sp. NPDC092370]|uniref:2Fe-2S iron-sulfur cluster-binding protein n=1 Tax=Streptomyces sp. NPDC092370 TaxID=3366016 RepID=UPI0037FE8DAF
MTDDQHGEGTPRGGSRWDPLPQGEYDDGATAFVELPEGGVDALLAADSPLAAPGHGYVPPQITVTPATTAGTDPAATGAWPVPGAPADGAQWHDPNAGHQQHGHDHGGHQQQGHDLPEQPYGSDAPYDPGTPYGSDAGARQHAGDDRFTYNPAATGQWNFEETAAAAPGHDVTGQWSIPVAGGDLPDESGEFTTSSLVEQWGGTPPATLPGGAPAPWATQAAGRPWGQQDPQDAAAQEQQGHPHEHGHEHGHEQGHGQGQGQGQGQRADAGAAAGYASDQQAAGAVPREAGPDEVGYPQDVPAPGVHEGTGPGHETGQFGHAPEPSGNAGHGPKAPHAGHAPEPSEYAPETLGATGHTAEPSRYADRGPEPASFAGPGQRPAEFADRGPGAAGFADQGQESAEFADRGPGAAGFAHQGQEFADRGQESAEFADRGPGAAGFADQGQEFAEFADRGPEPADAVGQGRETTGFPDHGPESAGAADQGSEADGFAGHGPDPSGAAGHPMPAAQEPEPYADAPGEFLPESVHEAHPEAGALPQGAPDAQETSQGAPGSGEPVGPAEDAPRVPEAADGPSEAAAGTLHAPAEAAARTGPDAADGETGDDRASEEAPATDPAGTSDAPAGAAPQEEHPLASYALRVNGTDRPVTDAWIGESLLYVLRERLGLAGAKDGCSQGECGACNVQVDGRLVASCLVPAVTAAGSEVRTVEGLAEDGQPSDVQRALARCGAVQCGFCVPGMAMTVHDLLEGNPAPTELETRQALCGNLCRCSGYRGVVDAVKEVVAEREAHSAPADGDTDEARIPHQAGPGAGGVNASAFGAPPEPHIPHSPDPHDQPYGQDGGPA